MVLLHNGFFQKLLKKDRFIFVQTTFFKEQFS